MDEQGKLGGQPRAWATLQPRAQPRRQPEPDRSARVAPPPAAQPTLLTQAARAVARSAKSMQCGRLRRAPLAIRKRYVCKFGWSRLPRKRLVPLKERAQAGVLRPSFAGWRAWTSHGGGSSVAAPGDGQQPEDYTKSWLVYKQTSGEMDRRQDPGSGRWQDRVGRLRLDYKINRNGSDLHELESDQPSSHSEILDEVLTTSSSSSNFTL